MDYEDDEDQVGPGRPPRKHQFKKGQSGNPQGRPKGSLNIKTIYLEEIATEVKLKNGDRISVLRAIVRQQLGLAAKGRLPAIESVLDRSERYQGNRQEGPAELPVDDAEILRRFGLDDRTPVQGDSQVDEDEEGDRGLSDV